MRLRIDCRQLSAAIVAAWPLEIWFLGLVVAGGFGFFLSWYFGELKPAPSPSLADAIRYAGMLLELAHLLIVAWGLRNLRRMFNRPSVTRDILEWFRRVASAFTDPKVSSAQMSLQPGSATVKAEGRIIGTAGAESTVDQRIAVIEENLNRLRDELDAKMDGLRKELAS